MQEFGKFLVIAGVLLTLVGFILWSGFGSRWLGRLPGDLLIDRGNFKFYFPIATSLLLSVLITLLFWLIRR
jgi:hypothetical protein